MPPFKFTYEKSICVYICVNTYNLKMYTYLIKSVKELILCSHVCVYVCMYMCVYIHILKVYECPEFSESVHISKSQSLSPQIYFYL